MTTTVWVRHEWNDAGLVWNPREYGNISKLQLPADDLWLPDTVLYNNADGDYQVTIRTKVTVHSDGSVVWLPPAIYKSFCAIDVKFFPFDEQVCELKFGPWSYDISKVDYWLFDTSDSNHNLTNFLAQAADMGEYAESVEWDILQVTGKRTVWRYPCCPEEYVDITYRIHIRRKTLFYTINLIIPCVSISFLTVFVFYLPSESGEKITLSISILVSLTVFILLLYEIIPPTSLALPLMSKYLLFTMVLVTLSIIVTILILNIHFRHCHAYDMPEWVRRVFLNFLPKLLFYESPLEPWYKDRKKLIDETLGPGAGEFETSGPYRPPRPRDAPTVYDSLRVSSKQQHRDVDNSYYENVIFMAQSLADGEFSELMDSPEIRQALKDVQYIANKYKDDTEEGKKQSDWEAVGRVMDRLFLFIFAAAVVIGACAILASAPALYDTTPAIG